MTQILPNNNESARSYLVRLSAENDYIEVKQLFSHYRNIKVINIASSESSIIECVCNLVDTVEDASFWPVSDEQQEHLSYLIDRHPVACPMCMRDQNYLVKDWQLMPITHCAKHQIKLINKCSCGEKFDWDSTLIEYGCSKCLSSWDDIANHCQVEIMPEHVLHFHSLGFEERASFLEDLAESIYRVLRPYDSLHNKIKLLPTMVDSWSDTAKQGYALLTDINAINTWCQSLASVRHQYKAVGERAVYFPVYELQKRLQGNWLIKGVKPNYVSFAPKNELLNESTISPCRIRNESAKKELNDELANEQLRHHLDPIGFAEMFNCGIALTRKLFKLECFKNTNSINSRRNTIIDIRLFMSSIRTCDTEVPENTVYLSELEELMSNYLLSDELLAFEIIAARLPLHIDKTKNSLIDSIKINEKVIINFLETEYLKKFGANFTKVTTAKIIGISRTLVGQLGKAGILVELDPSSDSKRYTGRSIANFLANYECIDRWGAIHNVDLYTIMLALIRNKIDPIFETSIYKKTPKFVSILNNLYHPSCQKRKQLSLQI
ncbi:TniQ family protein [Pseudocolwellia agarivorans]|uniref:TniQ family protein n=1 Tax=Pseudocolwellia agarivorans TaxID=1911682 RepID=UPI00158963C7|nr:TniQ family protein [Pseudocolwellia agarivorans]